MAVRRSAVDPRVWDLRDYDPTTDRLVGLDVLHQDKVWRDQTGTVHRLEKMTPRHRRNLLAFLRRRAAGLAMADSLAAVESPMAPRGDEAVDAMDRALDEQCEDPDGWLEGTRLVSRLRALVDADETGGDR